MSKRAKRIQPRVYSKAVRGELVMTWTCPKCEAASELPTDFSDIEGGCTGHGDGEYCYCSSREIRKHAECTCGQPVEVYVS